MENIKDHIVFEGEIILSANHPFVTTFSTTIGKHGKEWRVVWRDFITVKQEIFFKRKTDALIFAVKLEAGCRILSPYYAGFFADCNNYYYE